MKLFLIPTLMTFLSNYQISLKKNTWQPLPESHFKHATDGKEASQQTLVHLKYDEEYLYVKFEALQNPFLNQNTYTKSNDPLYNQEVFELFISDENGQPQHYLEFEINPNNAIWIGKIHNPTGNAPVPNETQMIEPKDSGIIHQVSKGKDSWSGSFQIPFRLIGKKQKEYRVNFFRIVALKANTDKNWIGNPSTCAYLCWSPTMSGKLPAFHRSAYFGKVVLSE